MTIFGPYDFSGGWNTKCGPYDAPPTSIVDGQNMELIYGRLAKKKGNIQWSSSQHPGGSGAITGLAYFKGVLVAHDNGFVATFSAGASGGSWTDITGGYAFAGGDNVWMAPLNNILAMGSFSAATTKWTGAGNIAALAGTPPTAVKAGAVANNYLFLGNLANGTSPHRVQWSAIQDPETWPAANFVDVAKDDNTNSAIIALFPFGEDLLIFKNNSIHRLYTNQLSGSLGPLIMVSNQYGCAGPQCVDQLPDGRIVFLGNNNHAYIYDGNTFDDISDALLPRSNIQTTLNALAFGGAFSQGFVKVFQGKSQVWFSFPGTYTSRLGTSFRAAIFIYDFTANCWLPPYVDQRVYKALNYTAAGTELFIDGGEDGRLYQEDSGNENSASAKVVGSFEAYFTKSLVFSPDSAQYSPRSAFFGISCAAVSATIAWGSNGFLNPPLSNIAAFTGSAQERKKVIPLTVTSKRWNTAQIKFGNAYSNQPFMVEPIFLSDEIEAQT